MLIYNIFSRHRRRIGLLAALLAVLAAGIFGVARTRADGRFCQSIGLLEVCADSIEGNSIEYVLKGNLFIGLKGEPPVIQVTDMTDFDVEGKPEGKARYYHYAEPHPDYGSTD